MAKFTDYTEKTEPVDTDLALIYDTQAKVNKKFTFGNLWKWIAKKIVSEGISQLETTNKTIPGAINELNSNLQTSVDSSNANDVRTGFSIIRWNSSTLNTSSSEKITEASAGIIISFIEGNDWGVQLSMQAGNNNFCYRAKSGTWSKWKSLMK